MKFLLTAPTGMMNSVGHKESSMDDMKECRDSSDIGQSIDLGFRGLTHKVSALQQKVASLKGDTVLSPAHHAYIKQMVDDLAASFSTAPHAIVENTSVKLPEPVIEEKHEEVKDGED